MSEEKMNRRSFLKTSSVIGVGGLVGASALLSACGEGNKMTPLKQPGEFYVPELPDKAIDGKENIRRAVAVSRGRIEIMAGSGVVAANAKELMELGVDALHFSAKKMVMGGMKYRNPRISMGGSDAVDEFALRTVDENEVKEILKLIK